MKFLSNRILIISDKDKLKQSLQRQLTKIDYKNIDYFSVAALSGQVFKKILV